MKYLLILVILTVLGFIGYKFYVMKKPTAEIHYHAGFLVYIDGAKQDFSDFKYMDLEPCTNKPKTMKEDDQKEKAHLHDGVGDVVHVHRSNATWGDLFKNIGYTFPANKPVVGYENGQKIDNPLDKPIVAYESIILVAGDTKNVDLHNPVTVDYIKEVESKSETCGAT